MSRHLFRSAIAATTIAAAITLSPMIASAAPAQPSASTYQVPAKWRHWTWTGRVSYPAPGIRITPPLKPGHTSSGTVCYLVQSGRIYCAH